MFNWWDEDGGDSGSGTREPAEGGDGCVSCDLVNAYVNLGDSFVADLSKLLTTGMVSIFVALAGVWIVMHSVKVILGKGDLLGLMQEGFYVGLAGALVPTQAVLIPKIYGYCISIMGATAGAVLSVGAFTDLPSKVGGSEGMALLVRVAEGGVWKIFTFVGGMLLTSNTIWDFGWHVIYGLAIVFPYFILLIMYFSKVVVSVFRVMAICALGPVLLCFFGFDWGRGMAYTGLRTLFASFLVLFAATAALAICLYAVNTMSATELNPEWSTGDGLSLDNADFWVVIAIGWIGVGLQMESIGLANSIAGSQLSNSAAATMTAGIAGTSIAALKLARTGGVAGTRKAIDKITKMRASGDE